MKKSAFLVLFVIYLSFIALGLPDALLGSGWNEIKVDLNVELGAIGLVTMFSYILTMTITYNAPRLLQKFQTKYIVFFSILLSGTGLLLISRITEFYQLIFLSVPLGVSAGAIDLSLNHYTAIHYKAKHMSYLHGFYGLGVTIGPLILSQTLENSSWRMGYIYVGLLLYGIAFIVLLSFNLWFKETSEHREEHHTVIPIRSLLKANGVLKSLWIFLLYVHVESLLGVFIASYVHMIKGYSESVSALATMTYFLALTVGRLLSGVFADDVHPNKLIIIGELGMVIGSILLILPTTNIIFVYGFIALIGIGSGPVFPNMMHMNPKNFGTERTSKIMSLQMVIGYLGFGLLTPLMGQIFQYTTIAIYPIITTMISMTLMIITISFMRLNLSKE